MIKTLFLFFFLVSIIAAKVQNKLFLRSHRRGEFDPEFPGGDQAFNKYLTKNIKVPQSEQFKGKVFVRFVIDYGGHIIKPEVI